MRAIFAVYCLIPAAAFAQSAGTARIEGIVTDAATQSPLRRAIIRLVTVERQPQDAIAWTDANGHYVLDKLPAGKYRLFADKQQQYTGAAFGSTAQGIPPSVITLAAGDVKRVDFRLERRTSISGVVVDQDGEPLPNVQVQLQQRVFVRRKVSLRPAGGAGTDATGRYRISGVMPGRYLVTAFAYSQTMKAPSEVEPGSTPVQLTFGMQYYPGTDAAGATLLEVKSGQDITGINFRLNGVPPQEITGRVIVPGGANLPAVSIQTSMNPSLGFPSVTESTSANPPEYTFQLHNVRPGPLRISATGASGGRKYYATTVLDREGNGELVLTLYPAADLTGTVRLDSGDLAALGSQPYVSIIAGDGEEMGRSLRAEVNKDGTFKIQNVRPGAWDIDAGPVPKGGYIKSMKLGDQDVLTQEMVIAPDTSAKLNIVIGSKGGAVQGSITNLADGSRGVVLLAPAGKLEEVTSFYKPSTTDDSGHYEITGIPPGSYRLYAFPAFTTSFMENLDALKPYEQFAVPISIQEGQNLTQDLLLVGTLKPPERGSQ